MCITRHSGYGVHDKCEWHCKYIKSATFPECHMKLHTDESFAAMTDERNHGRNCLTITVIICWNDVTVSD